MRSLTTIFAAVAIALSTCFAVTAAPQGNSSADRQLRQLEARYDTLSNLRYSNAYIEAEKRVLEAKIEKLKHQALSSKPSSNHNSSGKLSSQGSTSATVLEIIGPTNINKNQNESPIWQVEYDEFVEVNDDNTYINQIDLFGQSDSYPCFTMNLTNFGDIKLHQLNIDVWNKEKDYPSKLTFDNEVIPIKIRVFNNLRKDLKDVNCTSLSIGLLVEKSEAKRTYKALSTKALRSMTIGDVTIPPRQIHRLQGHIPSPSKTP